MFAKSLLQVIVSVKMSEVRMKRLSITGLQQMNKGSLIRLFPSHKPTLRLIRDDRLPGGVGGRSGDSQRDALLCQNAVCESPLLPKTTTIAVSSRIPPKRDEGSPDTSPTAEIANSSLASFLKKWNLLPH